jgi:hypothetical protein
MLAAVTLCVLLAVGNATGQFAPHEMPRTYRRPSPLYGLHELHDYSVNVDNDRNFYHKVEINGLLFEYNVTMQKGIYNLNEVCYLYRIYFQLIQLYICRMKMFCIFNATKLTQMRPLC